MNLSIKQLNKLTRKQRSQLKHKYKHRNCKHNHITWGVCDNCKKTVDQNSVNEFKRLHPHIKARV